MLIKGKEALVWTKHARIKMRFYKLSERRIKRVLTSPKRIEKGIAPNTIAMLQPAGSKKHPYEIWVMIQKVKTKNREYQREKRQKIKIISAWKYPGTTKPRSEIALNFLRNEYSDYISNEEVV